MKWNYLLIMLCSLLLSQTSNGQSWVHGTNSPDSFLYRAIRTDRLDNNILITDPFSSFASTSSSKLIKYDKQGNELWRKDIVTKLYSEMGGFNGLLSHAVDRDGNIYIVSTSVLNVGGLSFAADTAHALMKFSPDGILKWIKKLSFTYPTVQITCDSSYNLFLTAQSHKPYVRISDSLYGPVSSSTRTYITRLDTAGKVKWTRFIKGRSSITIGPNSYDHWMLPSIVVNNRSDVLLTGRFYDTVNISGTRFTGAPVSIYKTAAVFSVLYDQNGNIIYLKQLSIYDDFGSIRSAILYDDKTAILHHRGIDTIVTVGTTTYYFQKDTLMVVNAAGTIKRNISLKNGNLSFEAEGFARKDTGYQFYMGGRYVIRQLNATDPQPSFYQIRKSDTAGNQLWSRQLLIPLSPDSGEYVQPLGLAIGKEFITGLGNVAIGENKKLLIGQDSILLKSYYTSFTASLKEGGNAVSGRVYFDMNSNNVFDPADRPASYFMLLTNSQDPIFTDSAGFYTNYFGSGNFRDTLQTIPYYTATPSSYNYSFAGSDSTINNQDYKLAPTGIVNDLKISLIPVTPASFSRPSYFYLTYTNVGTTTLSGYVKMKLSPLATYVSSSRTPVYAAGDSLVWSFTNMKPFDQAAISVRLSYVAAPLNSPVKTIGNIEPVNNDSVKANNTDTVFQLLRGSYDPNDKLCNPVDTLNKTNVATGKEWIDYVIDFQNTGTDTATTVRVVDKLSPLLDLKTLEIMGGTHSFVPSIKGDILQFEFPDIDLPDSNVNKPGSMGAVYFRIKPKSTLVNGDTIRNSAAIFFDFNEPVITNTTKNYFKQTSTTAIIVVDRENRELNIFPNPVVRNELQFHLAGERITGRYNLRIIDMNGRVVQSSVVNVNGALNRISTVNLHAGVYLVEVYNDKRKYVASFVKR